MPTIRSRKVPAAIAERLRQLPNRPGVYFFLNAAGDIIYIGKSVSLRDRVRSYFCGQPATTKLRRLRREIHQVEWRETGSELEALLLESQLVKRHLPRFNTLLREFRARPYLRVDWRDPFPRLEVTREPAADGAEYFGPFGRRDDLQEAVDVIADTLRIRTCEVPGERLPGTRPCYRLELGTCSGPCVDDARREDYAAVIREAADLFGGRRDSPLQLLEQAMAEAAEDLRFEAAARLRDAIAAVRRVSGRQHALQSAIRRLNLVALCPAARGDCLSLFLFVGGRLALQRELARADLRRAAACRKLATEILAAQRAVEPPPPGPLPGAAVDEIQIVSAWMRQRNRQGTHLELAASGSRREEAARLAEWLRAQARGRAELAMVN